MDTYKQGTKVKYLHEGEERTGIIHGVQTYETPGGLALKINYLIDTGETVREDVVEVSKNGKVLAVARQPEQVTVPAVHVRPL